MFAWTELRICACVKASLESNIPAGLTCFRMMMLLSGMDILMFLDTTISPCSRGSGYALERAAWPQRGRGVEHSSRATRGELTAARRHFFPHVGTLFCGGGGMFSIRSIRSVRLEHEEGGYVCGLVFGELKSLYLVSVTVLNGFRIAR